MCLETLVIPLPHKCSLQQAQVMINDLQRAFYEDYDFSGFELKGDKLYAILKLAIGGSK